MAAEQPITEDGQDPTLRSLRGDLAWKGDEVFSLAGARFLLDDNDRAELAAAVVEAGDRDLGEIDRESFPLPRLGPRLLTLQHHLEHGCGLSRVGGFPLDAFSEDDTVRAFWGLAAHIGTAVPQTHGRDRIFHVRDEGFPADHPKARGPSSNRKLSFHTDRCDVIAFLCLQQATVGGENQVVSSATLFNRIAERRPDLLQVLRQPFFYERHNVDPGYEHPYYEQPIFSYYQGRFAANLLRVLIERAYARPELPNLSAIQREALDYMEELAEDPDLYTTFRQQPGDIVFMNNFTTLHRRTDFVDSPDPAERRHLLRLWLATPNSRPLDPRFAASYGSTQAGALRGGMRPLAVQQEPENDA